MPGTEWDPVLCTKLINDCRPKLQQALDKPSIFSYVCTEHSTLQLQRRLQLPSAGPDCVRPQRLRAAACAWTTQPLLERLHGPSRLALLTASARAKRLSNKNGNNWSVSIAHAVWSALNRRQGSVS